MLFGIQAAVRREVARSRQALYRLAYAWCHDASLADDLAQQAIEKALRSAAQVRDQARVRGWLCRILANCLRDHFRATREHEDVDRLVDTIAASGLTPEEAHAGAQLSARVRDAVARLPLGQRQVVTLVDLEGCSYAEVGEALEIPIGTVMSRLCRARQSLREQLLAVMADEREAKLRSVK
ncbi:MAG: sigma-70 family RNA polymerase sigma factor [Betaproteobacteria bacterium]|nr:MAG: sigma-70 family RNA polymerase sigma factor [Betaproteobacteria bacterium]